MNPHPSPPPAGLYDRLLDSELHRRLATASAPLQAETAPLDPGDSHVYLVQYLAAALEGVLRALEGPAAERVAAQLRLAERVLRELDTGPVAGGSLHPLRLLAVSRPGEPAPPRPDTPPASGFLLTGARSDPPLLQQFRKELASADRVDILCSFIRWTGVRLLEPELREFAARREGSLRVLTTAYMGATEARAVEFLAGLPGTELRISYDTDRTRLHAKAFVFHRNTGFGSAYIGSANLSGAALTDGLEWVVKISQHESPHLWAKLTGAFATMWRDPEFVPYSAANPADSTRLARALAAERGREDSEAAGYLFDIRPYPHQEEILARLRAERELHRRHSNLVVAATGTGKTVVAALDYRREWEAARARGERPPRLLFVAHREEILRQSLACFRGVLRDENFGELLVGGSQPTGRDALFVSIQSYGARDLPRRFAPGHFEHVVVDEFHHAAAATYTRLLRHVRPRILLGLTATPERADGQDVLGYFDGRIAAELRLAEAINRQLLVPFHYFAATDSANLDRLAWRRGCYLREELDRVYTGNTQRAELVYRQVREKLAQPRRARGLGFCVSVAHARYMAAAFSRAGLPSAALTGASSPAERAELPARLRRGELCFLFTVDLFNEGVDLPEVDTVLFLRPTESLTVFLQQLGRGLRRHPGKECLTVLDFVGQAHQAYDWESRFRALMDRPRLDTAREIEEGCVHVPLGCQIRLERVAQERVLANIRGAQRNWREQSPRLLRELAAELGRPPRLAEYLAQAGLTCGQLYRRETWTQLRRRAGLVPLAPEPDEALLRGGFERLGRANAPNYLLALHATLAGGTPHDFPRERLEAMLHVELWRGWKPEGSDGTLARLARNPLHAAELAELAELLFDAVPEVPPPLRLPYPCLLELHARYSQYEVLATLGDWTPQQPRELREGVRFIPSLSTELLFVTLEKTEAEYSPTTMYDDYAVSEELFHWQSQGRTSAASPTGQRYLRHRELGVKILLFVRERAAEGHLTARYEFLGPVEYVEHHGERPMSILWRLEHPLPARLRPALLRLAA